MRRILHERLPVAPWMADHTLRLPGTTAIDPRAWLQRDEAFVAQMAYRDALIAERLADVHAVLPGAGPAASEALETVLAHLADAPGYTRDGDAVRRPDGVRVPLDGSPLVVVGRLVQEDLCLMQKPDGGDEHVLTGAILCFPSNWTLAQKLGRGLARIHLPVDLYTADIARRVQRLFDLIRPEAPMMRANMLIHGAHDLFNPRVEFDPHHQRENRDRIVRVERQTLLRLPVSRAVVFSIHTYLIEPAALTEAQRARLAEARPDVFAPV